MVKVSSSYLFRAGFVVSLSDVSSDYTATILEK